MRRQLVSVSATAALLAMGVTALVCGFSVSPLNQDVPLDEAFAVRRDFGQRLVVAVMMLVVAAIGMTAGSWALLHLMPRRSRLTRAAVATYAAGSAGLVIYAAGLAHTRSLLDRQGVLHAETLDELRDRPLLQAVLVAWLALFLLGLVLLALGLGRNPAVPRWVPVFVAVFVVSQLVPLPGGHAVSVAQFVVLALALAQAALVANRRSGWHPSRRTSDPPTLGLGRPGTARRLRTG